MSLEKSAESKVIKNPWSRTETSMKKLQRILNAAKQVFYEKGAIWSMRELANRLDVGVSYLYRYVLNKRELWFAVITQEYDNLADQFETLVEKHHGKSLKLLQSFTKLFLKFAYEEFPRFYLMFLMLPPKSEKENGPFEQHQNPRFSQIFNQVFVNVLEEENLPLNNPELVGVKLWGQVLGVATLNSPIYDYFKKVNPYPFNELELIDNLIASIPTVIQTEVKIQQNLK